APRTCSVGLTTRCSGPAALSLDLVRPRGNLIPSMSVGCGTRDTAPRVRGAVRTGNPLFLLLIASFFIICTSVQRSNPRDNKGREAALRLRTCPSPARRPVKGLYQGKGSG